MKILHLLKERYFLPPHIQPLCNRNVLLYDKIRSRYDETSHCQLVRTNRRKEYNSRNKERKDY
jgi:hypothetical protein